MMYQKSIKKNVPLIKAVTYFLLAMAVVWFFTACTNNAYNEKEMKADSIAQAFTADSLKEVERKASLAYVKGKAVPNPEKKNGKWEVIVERNSRWEEEYAKMMMERDAMGIYYRTEIKPSYPGGEKALAKFIQENIVYPEAALENGVEGDVLVGFAIDENGKIYTPVVNGDLAGYGLDEAATNVVSKMPVWNAGQIRGRNVKSYFSLPIRFRIY